MRRALVIALPFALAVPVLYGLAFVLTGHPPQLGPFLVGVGGWVVALLLRTPIGLAVMQLSGSQDRAQTWVTASSGPLEEGVRLVALLLIGRDLGTALWLGLGWASIEVLYAIGNGFALSALEGRTDAEAERVRAMLPASAMSSAGVYWGVVERIWATAVHIGFTLIVAAVPVAVVATAIVHSLVNIAFLALTKRGPMLVVSLAGSVVGAALVGIGLVLIQAG